MSVTFTDFSPWVDKPDNVEPRLEGAVRCDVVVVGGGYTGLSTALSLREAGVDVVVLEAAFAGSGSSGRNAGHLTPTIGKDIPTLMRTSGNKRAEQLVRFADAAVTHTEQTIDRLDIDCGYNPSGNVLAGVHDAHRSRLLKAAETAKKVGADVRFLSESDMAERQIPPAFRFGILEERGGTLNPGHYVMGLRRAVIEAGVRLFENSPAVEIIDTAPAVVRTEHGRVTADALVIATNAYTAGIGFKNRQVLPLGVSLFETEPLSAKQRASIGWPAREGIYTSHEILESFHLTARNTIVGGSKYVSYQWRSQLRTAADPKAFGIIDQAFRQRFPQLADVRFATHWSGFIGFSLNMLPTLGTAGRHKNIHYGFGYGGHGVAQATLMGTVLSDAITGADNEWDQVLRRWNPSWPIEPIRWLMYNGISKALRAVDRRTDAKILNGSV